MMPRTVPPVTSAPRVAVLGSLAYFPAPASPVTSMRLLTAIAAAVLIAATLGGCSLQPTNAGITREQGDAILAELREIRRALAEPRTRPATDGDPPQTARVRLEDIAVHVLGAANAPVTLVEFTDYQCPFCKRFHDRSWPDLKRKYVDTGKVRYVVRDMPLPFHAEALPAAIAARCAGEQGQFWPVHDALFAAQALSAESLRKTVLGFGVAAEGYDKCVVNPLTRKAIDADIAEADRIGVTGTPGFVIAQSAGGKLEGALVLGAQSTNVFSSRIDALLPAAQP
jgi:protein-disulfide isomerase